MSKPHTRLELDSVALAHNIHAYKTLIGSGSLALVVKGNAYGHGLHEIINLTKDNPEVNWYCTFSLSEALLLRTYGIQKPILVLALIDADIKEALLQQIDLAISDLEQLKLAHAAAKQSALQAHIHLKIDTGLSRFGFLPQEALPLIKKIVRSPHLALRGICTHFAAAEQEDQSFMQKQLALFDILIKKVNHAGISIPYIHTSATSATLRHNYGNLFRIGAGTYGLWPSQAIKQEAEQNQGVILRQVLSWKSYVMQIRSIAQGAFIGYGCTFIAPNNMRIAIIPVGYADGYPRRLSNIGKVMINGQLTPLIGRVAMNTITVDVTNIPCNLGDQVALMADVAGLRAYDIAQAIGSYNPREIMVGLSNNIPRVIVNEQHEPYPLDANQPFSQSAL